MDEIAACPGIERDTVYYRIDEKRMPVRRIGRVWKFGKERLDYEPAA